jgi:hemoglobin
MKAPLSLLLATLLTTVLFLSFEAACGHKKPPVEPEPVEAPVDAGPPVDATPPPSLYDRLGGREGVSAIIDSFVANITADKVVSKFFAKTKGPKLDHFKQMLADQICHEAGGPCEYTGKSMKDEHKGMGITDVQFKALVQDLSLALEEKQVTKDDSQALLTKLGAMEDDIVEKKTAPKK